MALSNCNTTVDSTGRELLEHGTASFPIACYHDNLFQAEVPWHWHEELETVLITEGCAIISAGSSRRVISAGSGFFINGGVLHGAWNEGLIPCRFHSVVFHPSLVGGPPESILNQQYVRPLINNSNLEWMDLSPDVPWQKQVLDAIENTWQSCIQEPPGFEFQVRNQLSDLLFQLWQHMPPAALPSGNKPMRDSRRIKTMLAFIHDHFSDAITVSDIAASATVSDSECLRCFRSVIGITPIQYVKQYRIRAASRLLISTDEQIADIAHCSGFQDISYFTKSFREQMGCTPSQYRNTERRR